MRKRFNRIWFFPIGALALIVLYFIPPVNARLAPRLDTLRTQIKYFINPPEDATFQPVGVSFTPTVMAGTGTPLVIVAGREYGTGSSRDWAAKGTHLLGVCAVIAVSFERIHRSNLVGMGVLPLEFTGGLTRETLALDGSETLALEGLAALAPGAPVRLRVRRADGQERVLQLRASIDTQDELVWYRAGGIMHHVLAESAT